MASILEDTYAKGFQDGLAKGQSWGRQLSLVSADDARDEGYRAGWFEGRQSFRRGRWMTTVAAFMAGAVIVALVA